MTPIFTFPDPESTPRSNEITKKKKKNNGKMN